MGDDSPDALVQDDLASVRECCRIALVAVDEVVWQWYIPWQELMEDR